MSRDEMFGLRVLHFAQLPPTEIERGIQVYEALMQTWPRDEDRQLVQGELQALYHLRQHREGDRL